MVDGTIRSALLVWHSGVLPEPPEPPPACCWACVCGLLLDPELNSGIRLHVLVRPDTVLRWHRDRRDS